MTASEVIVTWGVAGAAGDPSRRIVGAAAPARGLSAGRQGAQGDDRRRSIGAKFELRATVCCCSVRAPSATAVLWALFFDQVFGDDMSRDQTSHVTGCAVRRRSAVVLVVSLRLDSPHVVMRSMLVTFVSETNFFAKLAPQPV